ncbi:MAG: DUF3316 domain-containing protein [Bacteroidaceae bacterium]|nr:DUF3316 domain-containing protein [Bacteroidaceae bacterium]
MKCLLPCWLPCLPPCRLLSLLAFLFAVGCGSAAAQEAPAATQEAPAATQEVPAAAQKVVPYRTTTHATHVGAGVVHQFDTYLSPLNYSGPQLNFLYETLRATRLADGRISFQSIWQGNFAYTKNRASKGRNLGGDISYDIAWHYNWRFGSVPGQTESSALTGRSASSAASGAQPRLRILLGPRLGANVGFLYNTRNSNNPAEALASVQLYASAAVLCHFRLWRQPLTARYQLDVPFMGIRFSPNYGQSYYEIFSEGHPDHNVCFTHPFNAFSSRHLLTLDFPFRRNTLRVGYLADIRQSHVNSLKYHSYSHAFLIGWVRHLQYISPRR